MNADTNSRFDRPPSAPSDAIAVLSGEHAELQALFARVSSPDEDRPAVLKQIMQGLANHLDMENQMLISVVKDRLEDGDDLAAQLSDDHDRVEQILTLLERRTVDSPDVPDLVTELLDITKNHVHRADAMILPGLQKALSAAELDELGAAMVSDERRLLTHSHPVLPDSGPLSAITHKIAEVVDHVRDHSSDGGRGSM